MSYLGYLCLGGRTIVNDCRTLARVADGYGPPQLQCRDCDPCCGDLSAGLGFPDGYNPADFDWFDGTQTSVDFAGLLIESIDGLGPGNFTRPLTEKAGVGAFIGQGRQSAPQIVVTGLLMAATCCAQDFGFQWLRKALRAPCAAGANCPGEDLLYLSCEPETPDLDCPENEDFDFEAWLAPYYRTLKNVALIDGPHLVERIGRACAQCSNCPIYRVQFTLAAGAPCAYLDPITLLDMEPLVCSDGGPDCIEWSPDIVPVVSTDCFPAGGDDPCIEWSEDFGCTNEDTMSVDCVPDDDVCTPATDCGVDPDCPVSVAPPAIPSIINPCVDECITAGSCSVDVDVPEGTFPSTGEGTLVVQVYTGSSEMRRIRLRVWYNPIDVPIDDLSDCDICSEINVSYVGPQSTLTIDGTTGTATILCPGGGTIRANPFIASATGSPSFSYPELEGCTGRYTVQVLTGPGVASDSWVSIDAVGREC